VSLTFCRWTRELTAKKVFAMSWEADSRQRDILLTARKRAHGTNGRKGLATTNLMSAEEKNLADINSNHKLKS
jgi:hypothetical protein